MNIQQSILIRRLKQQPKQSMGLLDDLANFVKGLGNSTTAIDDMISNLNALNTATLDFNRGLNKTVGINQKLSQIFIDTAKSSLYLEARNKDINRSFGVNSTAAAKLSSHFQTLSVSINGTGNDIEIAGEQMIQYGINIKKIIPLVDQLKAGMTDNAYYQSLSKIQKVLVTNNDLTAEQAESFTYASMQGGKAADAQLAYAKSVSDVMDNPDKTMGVFKQILEGVSESTADVQMGFSKIPGNLELAILKAKSLGFTMAQLKTTGASLLNIETSIADEIEYQLLSGNKLVGAKDAIGGLAGKSLTQEYRAAVLSKDTNKQANILKTILTQEGEQLETNLFSREKMSSLLGMDEATLSRAMQKNTLIEKLGGGADLFEKSGEALRNAAMEAAAGNAGLASTVQDLIKLDSEQDTRTTNDILDQILTATRERNLGKTLTDQKGYVAGTKKQLMDQSKKVTLATYKDSETETIGGMSLGAQMAENLTVAKLKATTIDAQSIEVTNMGTVAETTGKHDVVSMPGGGGRTLTGDFGAFSLDDRDLVMAGDPAKMAGGGNIDIAQLSKVFALVGSRIVEAVDKGTNQSKANTLFTPGLNNGIWG